MASRNPLGDGTEPEGGAFNNPRRSRTVSLLAVAGLVALTGAVLRISCTGHSCDEADGAESTVPFCSLPADIRGAISAGFRDGRSPDLLAVTGPESVAGGDAFPEDGLQPWWPSTAARRVDRVPIVFSGTGVASGASIPDGISLDDIAATLAHIAGERRPHPEVRSGSTVEGVATGEHPRLILEVVWKGVGSRELGSPDNEWPFLQGLMGEGAGSLEARVGSEPLDPAASLTTIGTGGLPYQHGITGTFVRNDTGDVVEAWSKDAPISVIATLADDLDETHHQRPLIGLVGTSTADQGVIGGNWYTTRDRDEIEVKEGASVKKVTAEAESVLGNGYGKDELTDLLAVVMEGDVDLLDQGLSRLVDRATEVTDGSVAIVVAGTGSTSSPGEADLTSEQVAAGIEDTVPAEENVIEATTPGGVYLDQARLAKEKISEDVVLSAMRDLRIGSAPKVFDDAFPAIAVSFERYC